MPRCKFPMISILNFIERKRARDKAPAPPIVPPSIADVDGLDEVVPTDDVEFVESAFSSVYLFSPRSLSEVFQGRRFVGRLH